MIGRGTRWLSKYWTEKDQAAWLYVICWVECLLQRLGDVSVGVLQQQMKRKVGVSFSVWRWDASNGSDERKRKRSLMISD